MLLDDYQTRARALAVYPMLGFNLRYALMGLAGEAGELAAAVLAARPTFDGGPWGAADERIKESGDVLWYVANVAAEMGLTLSEALDDGVVAARNFVVHESIEANALEICAAAGKALEVQKKLDRDHAYDTARSEPFDGSRVKILEQLRSIVIHIVGVLPVGVGLDAVIAANLEKLESRKVRGKLHGEGDNR